MLRPTILLNGLAVAAIAITATACNRQKAAPELQTTTGLEARDQPAVAEGCLRAGDAADTFVLMAADRTGSGSDTTTYQLTAPAELNLPAYVGKRVKISGTLRAEQNVTGDSGTVAEKPAKGTAGTPTVETKTSVDVKQMTVRLIQATDGSCSVKQP